MPGSKKRKSPQHPHSPKTSALKYVGYGTEQDRVALLESLPDAFVSVDTDWQFTYVNRQAETLLGKTREELLGRKVWDIFPIPADSFLYQKAQEAMSKQSNLMLTQFHPKLNKWFALRLYPFQDGLYTFCQDVTEHKQAEEYLHDQAYPFSDASKGMIVIDQQGKIIHWNEVASDLFGYSAQEMLGQTPAVLYPRFEKNQFPADLEQLRNGKEYAGLWQGRRKDGVTIWLEVKVTSLHDQQGKAIGYVGIIQGTAEPSQTEEDFLYYAYIAQNQLDAVIATDTNFNILSWNQAAERLYGWKKEEVQGKHVDAILSTEFFGTSVLESSEQLLNRGYWKGKVIQRHKDGTPLLLLASVAVIKDSSGKMIGAIAANREIPQHEERTLVEDDDHLVG
jgi:PAS domain S-box-containing protein